MKLKSWIHLPILIFFTTVASECPESGSCETCELTMSTSLESVDNVITVSRQDEITFTVNFQQRGHNGFTFSVNGEVFYPNIINPNFMCTSEGDTLSVTQTLEVRYHCIAVEPGSYRIEAYVFYCNRDYSAKTFTIIVENDPPMPSASIPSSTLSPSPTVLLSVPSILNPSSVPPTRSSMPSLSNTIPITLSASASMTQTSTSTSVSPSSTTDNDITIDHEGSNTVVAVICGLILIAVLVIIGILLLMYFTKRPRSVFYWCSEQPIPDQPGDHPIQQQTQYGSNTAISETSDAASGSFVAPLDFATPVESTSVPMGQLEQVVLSEPVTQEPNDASTPHQLKINEICLQTDV